MSKNTSKQVQERYGKDATYDTERKSLREGGMKNTFDKWGSKATNEYLDAEMATRRMQDARKQYEHEKSVGGAMTDSFEDWKKLQ